MPTSLTDVAPLASVAPTAFTTISSLPADNSRARTPSGRLMAALLCRRTHLELRGGRKRSHNHRPIGGLGSQSQREAFRPGHWDRAEWRSGHSHTRRIHTRLSDPRAQRLAAAVVWGDCHRPHGVAICPTLFRQDGCVGNIWVEKPRDRAEINDQGVIVTTVWG